MNASQQVTKRSQPQKKMSLADSGFKISYAKYMFHFVGGVEQIESSPKPQGLRYGVVNGLRFEVRCTREERRESGNYHRMYGMFVGNRCVHGFTGRHMVNIASKGVDDDE